MKPFCKYIVACMLSFFLFSVNAQTVQEQYKAKKKDTVYGIAQKYHVTIEELKAANPQMKAEGYQLKKGEVLNIPSVLVKKNLWTDTQEEMNQLFREIHSPLNVGIMLPLNDDDADGRRMTEYYRGFLMACDALKAYGVSVNLHAWNVDRKADIRTTLLEDAAAQCDIIFGPYYSSQVAPLAAFCQKNRIRLILPFSVEGNEVTTTPQIFKAFQSVALQNSMAVSAFVERFPNHQPVFVDCQDATSSKGAFTSALRQRLDTEKRAYHLTSLSTSDEQFAKAFSTKQYNVVILNSGRQEALQMLLDKMERLTATVQGLYISVYGYTDWLAYAPTLQGFYHKYDTYVPTSYFYNTMDPKIKSFETEYKRWFKASQFPQLPHYAAMGYDHARYFLLGLKTYGNTFTGSRQQTSNSTSSQTAIALNNYLQSPLHFKRSTETGGFMNDTFMLMHYKQDHSIDALNY